MERLFSEWDDAHAGHRERLRQRVEYGGFEGMQEHEVLEFLLCYAIPRQDVNALAHQLIRAFGSLNAVLHASEAELCRIDGLGAKSAQWLRSVGGTVDAYRRLDRSDIPRLVNYVDMFRHAQELYPSVQPPSTWQICLDRDQALIYQREICPSRSWCEKDALREALSDMLASGAHFAVMIQFIGNEPPEADGYDLAGIERYAATLHSAHCELADVLLIGTRGTLSLRKAGYIPGKGFAEDYAGVLAELPDPATLRLREK